MFFLQYIYVSNPSHSQTLLPLISIAMQFR